MLLGRSHEGPVHRLLTDIVMPRMRDRARGPSCINEARDARDVHVGVQRWARSRTQWAANVLLKPFTPEWLAAAVRDSLTRKAANRS